MCARLQRGTRTLGGARCPHRCESARFDRMSTCVCVCVCVRVCVFVCVCVCIVYKSIYLLESTVLTTCIWITWSRRERVKAISRAQEYATRCKMLDGFEKGVEAGLLVQYKTHEEQREGHSSIQQHKHRERRETGMRCKLKRRRTWQSRLREREGEGGGGERERGRREGESEV